MRLSALRPLLKFSTTRKMTSRSNVEPSNIVEQYTEVSQGPETTLQNSPQKSSLSGLSEPQYSTAEAEAKSKKSSKANPSLKKSKSAGFSAKKRKHGHISLDQEYGSDTDLEPKGKEPKNWREVMALIEEKRATIVAPVDEVGADSLGDWNEVERGTLDPKNARFRTLLALMLSSQTKDQVTAKAMENLKAKFNPLSVASMLTATPEEIDECINKVGFHNRKSQYISQVVQILQKEYDGDVPSTITAVTDLPGVGPKMGFLLMQIAWKKTVGIGVDTHVHRISNRLGWVHTKTPEETRTSLQSWLPKEYWESINGILVGYGQTICSPVGPKCGECPVKHLCPSAEVKKKPASRKAEL